MKYYLIATPWLASAPTIFKNKNNKKQYIKYFLIAVVLFIQSISSISAQPPRRDTVGWGIWRRNILRAPVVTGETAPITIMPLTQRLCFDKQVNLKLIIPGRVVEQCMYLNTREGYMGYLPPSTTGGIIVDIMPEISDFLFYVIGIKGNVYTYKNMKGRNAEIEHWVTTGNSQTHKYVMPLSTGPAALSRKAETRTYCDGRFNARAYKFDGGTATWYVYGERYPERLHGVRFLGNFGVGYLKTEEGLYLVLEMQDGANQYRISSIETVSVCFDPTQFKIMEDEFVRKRRLELDKERDKIARDEARANSGNCASQKMAVINFRREQLRIQEENLVVSQQGNTYQDRPTQQAVLGMMDPLTQVQGSILTTQVSICNLEESLHRSPSSANSINEKIGCNRTMLTQLIQLEVELKAIDVRFAGNGGQAFAEKSKYYMQHMPRGCN